MHSSNSDKSLSGLSEELSSEESSNGKSSEESSSEKLKVDETGGGLVRVKY